MHARTAVVSCAALALALAAHAQPAAAGAAKHSTRVVSSTAGGSPGYFYVGGPINVTLRGAGRGEPYELCMTPAPIDRPSCRRARIGRTVTGLAPSRAGLTKLRFELEDGTVIVRPIRVRRAPRH